MPEIDTRIDVRLPGHLVKRAAGDAGFSPNDKRTVVVRYALLRLVYDEDIAMQLAYAEGGRKKKNMAPADDRIGVPISSEHLQEIRNALPEKVTTSVLARYALYKLRGWPDEDAWDMAKAYRFPKQHDRLVA